MAAKAINADAALGVKLCIDSDTEGEPGWAPVTATILKKIENCDIFMPDLSFVSKTEAGKLIPNPNVLFESGYAMHARTLKAMMPVMNAFYGPPEKLPFDTGHLRHPISYCIDPASSDPERRRVRAQLARQLEEKLRLQIDATKPAVVPPPPFPRVEEKNDPSRFREEKKGVGFRWSPSPFLPYNDSEVFLSEGPTIWLRVFPEMDPGKTWAAHELKEHAVQKGSLLLEPFFSPTTSNLRAEDGFATCYLQDGTDPKTTSVAFWFSSGEIWSIDTTCLRYNAGEIPYLETEFMNRLEGYVMLLRSLGLKPPFRWIGGLAGVKSRTLGSIPGQLRLVGFPGPKCLSNIIRAEGAYDANQSLANSLLPLFKQIFDACGMSRPTHLPS